MPFMDIDADNAIRYEYHPPTTARFTFVICHGMGLSTAFWQANIAPDLQALGFGTLCFDYRGQGQSRFGESATLEPDEIVGDIVRLVAHVQPENPVLVGLAIGGQYAAQAILRGVPALGLIMSNSLRANGPHTEWMIELEGRLLEMGGKRLANDALSPSIYSNARLAEMRPAHLTEGDYEPLPPDNPRVRIQWGLRKYKWDLRYEDLKLPVLVMTGKHNRRSFPSDVAAIVARMPDVRTITYEDGGLSLHRDLPQDLVRDFSAFAAAL